jgi:hypothetical protein
MATGHSSEDRNAGADFSSASGDFKALGAFFCNFPTPEPPPASRAPVYQMLWVRGFRGHTICGRGFNLFKPLRRHFRAVLPSASRAAIPANETPRSLLRPEPHEFSRLDAKAAPTPGSERGQKSSKNTVPRILFIRKKNAEKSKPPISG